MAKVSRRVVLLRSLIAASRRRRSSLLQLLSLFIQRRKVSFQFYLFSISLLFNQLSNASVNRSCRRLPRNSGWWSSVATYSDSCFKETFRISRKTFNYILSQIKHKLVREEVTERPVPPDFRLALFIYRMARGDYFFTMSQMCGLGESTVSTIVSEVNDAIVACMWESSVKHLAPKNQIEMEGKMLDMEELWQFPYAWAAVDGSHLRIKCPDGGAEAKKEYHNFKNFYSIVLMAMVDAKRRFVWASCGFPGNSHDSIIFKATEMFKELKAGKYFHELQHKEGESIIPPLVLGDSAFEMESWLQKPYSHATLTPQQHYYNYRLSRARMVVEGAFGMLKGRWRVLLRRHEGGIFQCKLAALGCIILHNVCIEMEDNVGVNYDLTFDPMTRNKRDRSVIRDLLHLSTSRIVDNPSHAGIKIRESLKDKLWLERSSGSI